MPLRVSSSYEHALQSCYWDIGNRGIRVAPEQLSAAMLIVDAEVQRNLAIAARQWDCSVFVGAANAPKEQADDDEADADEEEDSSIPSLISNAAGSAVNLNATQGKFALLSKLKDLGYNVPKIAKKNEDGDYESNFSTGELAIQKMLAENQFKYPGGDSALRAVLKVRELQKLKTSYLNARLFRRGDSYYFLCIYNVAGTTTGRRSSRRHTFGFGNNGQNFPKHSEIAALFRRALVPREGNIFLFVDQIQAEDWPVSALAQNGAALVELRNGADRHSRLASTIFGHRVPAKSDPDWNKAKYETERYIGKKARHANNYGMTKFRFQDVLVQEAAMTVDLAICGQILNTVDQADPSVRKVFHKYVTDTLSATRVLVTPRPFLRERQFLSLRPTDQGSNAFKEAFAYIPQSTVGDNTGFSLLDLETTLTSEERAIVQEGHDSLVQDILDTPDSIYSSLLRTTQAFSRKITFHNGIEIEIPIEAEIGYDFATTVKIESFTLEGVRDAHQKLQDEVRKSNVVQIALGA